MVLVDSTAPVEVEIKEDGMVLRKRQLFDIIIAS